VLVVNADDWGGYAAGTDAIERCFAAGAITSTTAMVGMADSARAAALARERDRPTGLHLNLTQPFDGPGLSQTVRDRQAACCGYFADLRLRRWTVSPWPVVRRTVRDAVADQLAMYEELFDTPPPHVDGHLHVHVCPDVARVLPRGMAARQTRTAVPGRRPAPHAAAKATWMAQRFRTTARFWGIEELLRTGTLEVALDEAHRLPVEIMVHPTFTEDLEFLLSDAWAQRLRDVPRGTYTDVLHR
jgi:predicted glycoside hydrolase/deacetylase ChbG (UPF0249 family)